MKKAFVLGFTLVVTTLCIAQEKAPKWHPDDWQPDTAYHLPKREVANLTSPQPTGRIRTINTRFVTIYSPKEYPGYVTQKEMKMYVGEEPYLYWADIVYFRLLGPFKKRKEYQLNEIYNPGL